MKKFNKILSLVLALAMIVSMCPGLNLTAFAVEAVATGSCGDNLTYSVNDNGDGTYALVIEGSGAMTDYSVFSGAPWTSYRNSISSVSVSDGVTSIGKYAFYNSIVLTEVTIPATVTTVGTNAFAACEALTTVTFGGTQEQWEAITFSGGNTYLTDATITYAGSSEGEGDGEEAVTSEFEVTDGVLVGYTGEGGNVVIPADLGITQISEMAFKGNTTITSLVIPEGVTSMSSQTFMNCISLASLTLPTTLTEIPSQMCYSNALTEIVIPEGVVKIHTSAFDGCTSLTSVTLPSTLQYIYGNAFRYCSSLKEIDIPDSVIYVSNEAFDGAGCIETEGNVKYVDGWALGKAVAAESYELREGTVGVAYMAFYNTSKVTSVTLPESLKYLNDYALGDCANLTSITFKGDAPTTGSVPFGEGYNTECVVYYYEGANGFTETWNKLPTVMLTEGGEEGGEETDDNLLYGGETLAAGGEYQLAPTATGIITISTTEAVTIVGNGATWDDTYTMTSTANAALGIDYTVAGADLTIKDIFATISSSANLIDFMGTGNKLTISGVNLLENENASFTSSVIHVPAEGELTISGEGALYIYKSAGGTAIGGDNGETNGHIIINGGTIFAKGSKTGAVIGAGQSTIGGPITINGGNLYAMGKARGACLGGGGYTGGVVGTGGAVTINGGNVMLVVDYNGASIGGGGQNSAEEQDGGTVVINGGSLKCRINSNAYTNWGLDAAVDANDIYRISDVTITAEKLNSSNEAVYVLPVSLEGVTANSEGDAYVVIVDGNSFYSGNGYSNTYYLSNTTTVSNWPAGDPENSLYLYLTGENHTVSVNGTETTYYWDEEASAFTTTKPTYAWYETTNADGAYEIDTAEELKQFAAIVNGTDELYAQDNFSGKTVVLANNIVLAADGLYTAIENVTYGTSSWPLTTTQYVISTEAPVWTPIGSGTATSNTNASGNVFSGTFDGAGYTVSGIFTGTTDSTSGNTEGLKGLFGIVTGTVKNVTVSGCITGKVVVGGVVAYLNGGTVENCINNAIVFSDGGTTPNGGVENGISQGGATGGIVGLAAGTGSVTGCTNNAVVICANSAKGGRVGGIVGLIDVSTDAISISKCVNNGNVDGYQYVAGIVGMNYAKNSPIDSCVNHGKITFHSGGKSHAGGIVGQFDCQVTNCYNTGNIHSTNTVSQEPKYFGGVAGDYVYTIGNGKVVNCYNTGAVTYSQSTCSYAGIVLGDGPQSNCYYLDTALANSGSSVVMDKTAATSVTAEELKAAAMVTQLDRCLCHGHQGFCRWPRRCRGDHSLRGLG